jgi:hypothetical protein
MYINLNNTQTYITLHFTLSKDSNLGGKDKHTLGSKILIKKT